MTNTWGKTHLAIGQSGVTVMCAAMRLHVLVLVRGRCVDEELLVSLRPDMNCGFVDARIRLLRSLSDVGPGGQCVVEVGLDRDRDHHPLLEAASGHYLYLVCCPSSCSWEPDELVP